MDLGVLLVFPQGGQFRLEWGHARALSSRALSAVSRFPSRGSRDLWLSLEVKHDLVTREDCRVGIDFLCEEIGYKLRQKSLKCNTVAITIKDTRLKSIQRQRPLENASDISREIADLAFKILCDEWDKSCPIRMISVAVTGLVDFSSSFTQLDLFSDAQTTNRDKEKKKEETVDAIRNRFGSSSILNASLYNTDIGVGVKNS